MTETRHEFTFVAKDATGNPHKILVFQDVSSTKLNNRTYETRGPLRLRTIEGQFVTILGQGKYQIVGVPDGVLTTTDSGAPGYRDAERDKDWSPLD